MSRSKHLYSTDIIYLDRADVVGVIRPAVRSDAMTIARVIVQAQGSWREWAGRGFTPYTVEDLISQWESKIADPLVVTLVDVAGGVGSFEPEAISHEPSNRNPESAHLSSLFVEPRLHGTGLAQQLHDAVIATAADRGYRSIRLWVPTGAPRARRFYERSGWIETGICTTFAGLERLEYRRPTRL